MKRVIKSASRTFDEFAQQTLKKYRYEYLEIGETDRDDYPDYCEAMLPDDKSAYLLVLAKIYAYIEGWDYVDTSPETTEELLEAIDWVREDEPEACASLLANPSAYLNRVTRNAWAPGGKALTAIKRGSKYLYDYYDD